LKKITFTVLFGALLALFITSPALAASRPLLVIDHYETRPVKVEPGRHFTLNLRIKNAGERRARQVMLTLSSNSAAAPATSGTSGSNRKPVQSQSLSPTADFTTLETSNIKYIGDIAARQEKSVSFNLAAANIAGSKVADLTFNLSYADGNRDYTSRQSMGITILRRPDIIVDQIKYPRKIAAGKRFKLSAEVINAGNFTVNGIRVKFISRGLKTKKVFQFIGPLESGDSDIFETGAKANADGKLSGKIVVGYRDDFNQLRKTVKKINITVKKATHSAQESGRSKKSTGIIGFIKALLGIGEAGK